MPIDNIKTGTLNFFPTLREQQKQAKENPYALRDDLIKPLPPEGHLIHTNPLNAPKQFISGISYNLKALKKGFNGTANDHELGKLNSIGLVTGGTALATYLATRKQTASSKAMEFVGIGSFLASMSLWPVIAIQIPTKLIHGFNVRQHYKDSMDREKLFFNDPQYLPWDLYSDEQINKVGDYMRVPQNMNNRRDYIQEKMKKIATQDNTLWMLSAGFAVPVMSSLICNQLEGPVQKLTSYFKNEQNKKLLQKALDTQFNAEDSEMFKRLNSFLELNNGKPMNNDLINQVCEIISYGSNPEVNSQLHAELRSKLTSTTSTIEPQDSEKVLKALKKNLTTYFKNRPEAVQAIMLTTEELNSLLTEGSFINRNLTENDFRALNKGIIQRIVAKMDNFNESGIPESEKITKAEILSALNNKTRAGNAVHRFRLTRPSIKLDDTIQRALRIIAKELTTIEHKSSLIKDYIFRDLSAAPETRIANLSNQMTEEIFKALNIPWKQMDNARANRDLMSPVIRSSIDRIASDKGEFEKVMKRLAEIAKRVDEFDNIVSHNGTSTFFEKTINSVLTPGAQRLEKMGFTDTAYAIAGNNADSEKSIMKAFANNRLLGIKSTIYRLITALDLHRRLATMTNVGNIVGQDICRELKEEIVELSKRTTLTAHRSDFATKFFFSGNPHPNLTDLSDIEVQNGRVVNKYYKAGTQGYKDITRDGSFYRSVMSLMYGEGMHAESQTILGKNLVQRLNTYRNECHRIFGQEWYFIKPEAFSMTAQDIRALNPNHNGGVNYLKPTLEGSNNKYKFLMTGVSMDDMAMRYAKQKHNSKAWMKTFGGLGLGIFTATVAAQFFFGKTPKPKEQQA